MAFDLSENWTTRCLWLFTPDNELTGWVSCAGLT